MRKLAFAFVWLYAFSIPWEGVQIPAAGTVARGIGVLALAWGVIAVAISGRLRRPGLILWLGMAFTVASALSLIWTVSLPLTLQRVVTGTQLLASMWLVREFARSNEQVHSLLLACCLGCFVPMANLLNNFVTGRSIGYDRFTSTGAVALDPNDLGLTLALAMPMAWHLMRHRSGWVRVVLSVYFVAAPFVILLTGSRGGFVVGLIALSIVPFTVRWSSPRSVAAAVGAVIAIAVMTAELVPESIWARFRTIETEFRQREILTLSGRIDIWRAGVGVAIENPLLGAGAGAYPAAIQSVAPHADVAHNTYLGVLAEQGLLGLLLFVALLSACAWTIARLPPADRPLWIIVGLSWAVGVFSLSWEARKLTWLLFGFFAAQADIAAARQQISSRAAEWKRAAPLGKVTVQPEIPHRALPQH